MSGSYICTHLREKDPRPEKATKLQPAVLNDEKLKKNNIKY